MKQPTSYPREKVNILLLEGIHPGAIKLFKNRGYSSIRTHKGSMSEDELIKNIKDVHLLGIRSKTQITSGVLKNADKLLSIGAFCIGTNQIDIDAAIGKGVAVFNSPYSNTRSVAEMVISLCISIIRKIPMKSAALQNGTWLKSSEGCFEVRGKTLGIIGCGHIGSQVSVLAEAIGMHVIYFDIEQKLSMGNAKQVNTLNALLRKSDIVSLHVPGTTGTKNLIGEKEIKMMKEGSILINLSRGDVVNHQSLRKNILNSHLSGAAIDVFPNEPQSNLESFNSELTGLPNVILTPHIGGSTIEAQENIGTDVAGKQIAFLETGTSAGSLSIPVLHLPEFRNAHRLLHIHKNVPGILSNINRILSDNKVNILGQNLNTNNDIGYVVLDIDRETSPGILKALREVKHTIRVRQLY